MRYVIDCEQTIAANLTTAWHVWTDLARFPTWDPREEEMRFEGPFAVGAKGFSKQVGGRPGSTFEIVAIEPCHRWVNSIPLPGGSLTIEHLLTEAGNGHVHLLKRYAVEGPMALAFRLFFAREIRLHAPATFSALEAEAARYRPNAGQTEFSA